jgi:hypothetical protein
MSNISCIEFNRLIEQAVESRSPVGSASLRAHATECTDCRAAWLDAMLLDGAVAEWRKTGKKILPSVDLADIVLSRRTSTVERLVTADITPFAPQSLADQDAGDRAATVDQVAGASIKPSRTRSVPRAVTSAIVLAVAVVIAFFWNRTDREPNKVTLTQVLVPASTARAANPTESPRSQALSIAHRVSEPAPPQRLAAPLSAAPVEAPVAAMVQGAQSAYLDLANEAAQAVSGATALVPRPGLASAMAPIRDENDRWVDDVGQQFEPVGKNLSQAFQFILEAVPAEKAPAT